MSTTQRALDTQELEQRVKEMYREVAEEPDNEFHFETGRPLAERLGYPAAELDAIPAPSIDSFAGVGANPSVGDSQHASGTGTNTGNNPPGIGCPDMSDHCGNQGGNSGSASNTGNNPPGIGCPDMSDHCGQKDNGATATGFKAPAIAGTTPAVQPTVLGGKPPISFDKPVASGPPLTIAPQH